MKLCSFFIICILLLPIQLYSEEQTKPRYFYMVAEPFSTEVKANAWLKWTNFLESAGGAVLPVAAPVYLATHDLTTATIAGATQLWRVPLWTTWQSVPLLAKAYRRKEYKQLQELTKNPEVKNIYTIASNHIEFESLDSSRYVGRSYAPILKLINGCKLILGGMANGYNGKSHIFLETDKPITDLTIDKDKHLIPLEDPERIKFRFHLMINSEQIDEAWETSLQDIFQGIKPSPKQLETWQVATYAELKKDNIIRRYIIPGKDINKIHIEAEIIKDEKSIPVGTIMHTTETRKFLGLTLPRQLLAAIKNEQFIKTKEALAALANGKLDTVTRTVKGNEIRAKNFEVLEKPQGKLGECLDLYRSFIGSKIYRPQN